MHADRLLVVCRLIAVSAVCFAFGCTGSGAIRFVSLHPTEIDPPHAKVWRFDAQECYWWIDDAGKINIALKHQKRNLLLGKLGLLDLSMSLVLDEPPAGSGRNYRAGGNTLRATLATALNQQKLCSLTGIVAVMVDDATRIHGSFRLWVRSRKELQLFSFLPDSPGRLLCFGTFRAVLDPKRGRAIRHDCEAVAGLRAVPKRYTPTTQMEE